jgi:predicted nucleic acid-binding protein
VACDELVAELRDVAGRPFFLTRLRSSAAELLAAGIRDFALYCRDLPSGPVAPDPKDSYLLALAETSNAEFLVTGDKQILALSSTNPHGLSLRLPWSRCCVNSRDDRTNDSAGRSVTLGFPGLPGRTP